MNIFDHSIKQAMALLSPVAPAPLRLKGREWEILPRNPFLMERDTRIELGGYPKESINLILPTGNLAEVCTLPPGIYCIGDPALLKSRQKQISFGKIVLLETEEISEAGLYDFTQELLLADTQIRLRDVMQRQSPTHYNLNLRIGRKALKDGLDLSCMAETIYRRFLTLEQVRSAVVILLIGDSPLYRSLLQVAETARDLTLTLNHIFDGIDMDCGKCDFNAICDEIEGLRELHKKRNL